jgi:hypothetical protein
VSGDPGHERAFLALWLLDDGRVLAALRALYAAQTESWVAVFDIGLPLFGRRCRAPWTSTDLAVSVMALSQGYFLRWSIDPSALEADGARVAFVDAVLAVAAGATEAAE